VTVQAIGAASASGIKEVVFFVGKPEGDKLPPKAEPAGPDKGVSRIKGSGTEIPLLGPDKGVRAG
jgi:hypothetical protein